MCEIIDSEALEVLGIDPQGHILVVGWDPEFTLYVDTALWFYDAGQNRSTFSSWGSRDAS
jgi:hypothetical protein